MWLSPAWAAPVLWSQPPTPEQRSVVQADPAAGTAISLTELRDQLGGPSDAKGSHARLATALKAVRAYETRLDGERIIMDDLQAALDQIEVVRNEEDRGQLFRALAYQGFAAHRFFADDVSIEGAEVWHDSFDGEVVPTPWRDATALAPDREVTAYDIAEAPQRVAYGQAATVVKGALPGGLRIEGADRGKVRVDGTLTEVTGTLRLPPGTHYLHREIDGRIVAHRKVSLPPGATEVVDLSSPAAPEIDLTVLTAGGSVPKDLLPLIEAAGGELWVATPTRDGAQVVEVDKTGVSPVELRGGQPKITEEVKTDGIYAVASLSAGWLTSGDFYLQAPDTAPHSGRTVNSAALGGGIGAGLQLGVFRAEGGLDAVFTPGEFHVALSGDGGYRLRPVPYGAVGVTWLMAQGGFVFPYHPFVGAKAALPLPAGFEIRADFRAGIPTTSKRSDDSSYTTVPLFTAGGGIAFRLGPGARTSTF